MAHVTDALILKSRNDDCPPQAGTLLYLTWYVTPTANLAYSINRDRPDISIVDRILITPEVLTRMSKIYCTPLYKGSYFN